MEVVPYSSKSGSFLHIHDLERDLPCGHSQLIHVDSIFGKEALGSEMKNVDLVFMVSPGREGSRNQGVYVGRATLPHAFMVVSPWPGQ